MGLGEVWAADPDLETRDPNNLNDHLKVTFEEALGEPDHTHALDCVWKYSYKCFNFCKALCYLIATTLCCLLSHLADHAFHPRHGDQLAIYKKQATICMG